MQQGNQIVRQRVPIPYFVLPERVKLLMYLGYDTKRYKIFASLLHAPMFRKMSAQLVEYYSMKMFSDAPQMACSFLSPDW